MAHNRNLRYLAGCDFHNIAHHQTPRGLEWPHPLCIARSVSIIINILMGVGSATPWTECIEHVLLITTATRLPRRMQARQRIGSLQQSGNRDDDVVHFAKAVDVGIRLRPEVVGCSTDDHRKAA